ncbi:hypothetical protein QL285_095386 [Trifolium repens]|nr:hypothetical protein QL285_095386 [Trifolium repens]
MFRKFQIPQHQGKSCAAEIANVSQVPNSSASGEKEEGLSEKEAVSEHVECLSEKGLTCNSEADVTKQKDEVVQEENAPKD